MRHGPPRAPGDHRPRHHDDAQPHPAGIRANKKGEPLATPILKNGAPLPTYSHDRVVAGVAPAATPDKDAKLLREVARNVVRATVRAGSVRNLS